MTQDLKIVMTNDPKEVERLIADGYCPVECSSGNTSFVDDLDMDHHGEKSGNESVAIRAYRDHFGAREDDPRFVVMGVLDADASFAVLALAGKLPHPDSKYAASFSGPLQRAWQQDLTPLANTIATIDTDPVGRDVLNMPQGELLVTWNALFGGGRNNMEALAGAQGWLTLTTKSAAKIYIEAGKLSEEKRRSMSYKDLEKRVEESPQNVLLLSGTSVFGFPEWYGRDPEKGGPNEIAGWKNPLVVALTENGNITFGAPNDEIAEKMLGKGGLQNVFDRLNKEYKLEADKGFGGRKAVGGSPRGMTFNEDALINIGKIVGEVCNEVCNQKLINPKILANNAGKGMCD